MSVSKMLQYISGYTVTPAKEVFMFVAFREDPHLAQARNRVSERVRAIDREIQKLKECIKATQVERRDLEELKSSWEWFLVNSTKELPICRRLLMINHRDTCRGQLLVCQSELKASSDQRAALEQTRVSIIRHTEIVRTEGDKVHGEAHQLLTSALMEDVKTSLQADLRDLEGKGDLIFEVHGTSESAQVFRDARDAYILAIKALLEISQPPSIHSSLNLETTIAAMHDVKALCDDLTEAMNHLGIVESAYKEARAQLAEEAAEGIGAGTM